MSSVGERKGIHRLWLAGGGGNYNKAVAMGRGAACPEKVKAVMCIPKGGSGRGTAGCGPRGEPHQCAGGRRLDSQRKECE